MKKITFFVLLIFLPVVQVLSQTRLETLIQNTETCFTNKDWDNALIYLNEAISIDSTNYRFWGGQAVCYYNKNNFTSALSNLNKTLELMPGETTALTYRAYVKRNIGDNKGAVEDFTRLIEKSPNYDAYLQRGMCYLKLKDNKAAHGDFYQCTELKPEDALAYSMRARTGYENNEGLDLEVGLISASINNKNAWKLDSTLFDVRLVDLQIRILGKRFEGVEEALTTMWQEGIRQDEVSLERGRLAYQQGDYMGALYQLNKALIVNPRFAEAYVLRAKSNLAISNYSRALEDANKALSLDSLLSEGWLIRGRVGVLYLMGIGSEADFTRSIECPGSKAQAYRYRAEYRAKAGKLTAAEQDYLAAIDEDPFIEVVFIGLGKLYLTMGNANKAFEQFHKVNTKMEPTPMSWCGEGNCLLLQNNYKEAMEAFEKAKSMDETTIDAYMGIGRVQAKQAKFEEAIGTFTKVIKIKDIYIDAYYERGCAYLSTNQKEAACSDFSLAAFMNHQQAILKKAENCQ